MGFAIFEDLSWVGFLGLPAFVFGYIPVCLILEFDCLVILIFTIRVFGFGIWVVKDLGFVVL